MRTLSLILIFASVTAGSVARAGLGQAESSVDQDQIQLKAQSHTRTTSAHFKSHILQTTTATVTEYIDASGNVFAVSWHGIVKPDLSKLLGSYYSEYEAIDAARPRLKSRQPVVVKTANIVVEKGGHMRDLRGKAYLPSRLPANVKLGELE